MSEEKELFSMEQMATLGLMHEKIKEDMKADIRLFINAVQHMEKKFNEMKEAIKPMMTAIRSYDEKHTAHYRMAKSLISYMRDMDTKVDAIRKVFESKYMEDVHSEIDEEWDKQRGLRLKTDQEAIGVGDIVWIDYDAEIIDGPQKGKTFSEKNFPVRVGSNVLVFDDMLDGKFIGTTFDDERSFPKDKFKDWEYAGNRIKFRIVILKAKTSLPEV